jgi:hypothetical protein
MIGGKAFENYDWPKLIADCFFSATTNLRHLRVVHLSH